VRRVNALLAVMVTGLLAVAPAPERLPALAEELARRHASHEVRSPGGTTLPLFTAPGGETPLLTVDRMTRCLETVSEAEAWPAAWLVVRDARWGFDLILGVRLESDGTPADLDPVLAVPGREWDAAQVERAIRDATGKKPPRGRGVVIQTFTTRTEVTYVYDAPPPAAAGMGLMALLPPGAILRDATLIDLADGRLHTLALALEEARFEASACFTCGERLRGHADTGKITLVLAGEAAIEARLDLGPTFERAGVVPWLPRYGCEAGDTDPARASLPPAERFAGREPIELLAPADVDGDGLAREIVLPLRAKGCEGSERLIVRVMADPIRLVVEP
jgi:hypothetical protein